VAIGNWQQLTNSGIESEATIVSSQSVIGEKYLEAKLQWTVGNGQQVPKSRAMKSVRPVKV
jgi:hypothetical protein